MPNKTEIKDYAKDLYLQVTSEGKRAYSLDKIADEIKTRFNEVISRQTISNWKNKGGWDDLFLKIKQYGIKKAVQEEQLAEDELIEVKGNEIKKIYSALRDLFDSSKNILLNRLLEDEEKKSTIKDTDLVGILKASATALLKLNEINSKIEPPQETDKPESPEERDRILKEWAIEFLKDSGFDVIGQEKK